MIKSTILSTILILLSVFITSGISDYQGTEDLMKLNSNYKQRVDQALAKQKISYSIDTIGMILYSLTQHLTEEESKILLSFPNIEGLKRHRPEKKVEQLRILHTKLEALAIKLKESQRSPNSIRATSEAINMTQFLINQYLPLLAGTTNKAQKISNKELEIKFAETLFRHQLLSDSIKRLITYHFFVVLMLVILVLHKNFRFTKRIKA